MVSIITLLEIYYPRRWNAGYLFALSSGLKNERYGLTVLILQFSKASWIASCAFEVEAITKVNIECFDGTLPAQSTLSASISHLPQLAERVHIVMRNNASPGPNKVVRASEPDTDRIFSGKDILQDQSSETTCDEHCLQTSEDRRPQS